MPIDRRDFVRNSAYAMGFLGLTRATHAARKGNTISPYGPLVKDPKGILDLPKDFTYQVISKAGGKMSDGFVIPDKPDDMAAFPLPVVTP